MRESHTDLCQPTVMGGTDPTRRRGRRPRVSRVNITGMEARSWIILIIPLALKIAVSVGSPNDSNTVGLHTSISLLVLGIRIV
jgi:hypothetical protein